MVLAVKLLVNWKLIHFLQELTIWAYPKTPGEHKDALVCCIKDNPEPVTYDIKCVGVNPQIQLDRKTIQFEKVWRFNRNNSQLKSFFFARSEKNLGRLINLITYWLLINVTRRERVYALLIIRVKISISQRFFPVFLFRIVLIAEQRESIRTKNRMTC